MKILGTLISAVLIAIVFVGCGKSDNEYTVNIKMEYGGESLVMYDEVTYPDGTRMRITDVKGYVSSGSFGYKNSEERVFDVKFLELGDAHSDAEEAAEGYNWKIKSDFKDLFDFSFKIGISDEDNNTKPADYDSSNDLSRASEYWPNWGSYIYFKVEGNADFNGDGEYGSGENIVIHLGTESASKWVGLDVESADETLPLILDIRKVFEGENGLYDLEAMPTIHATLNDEVKENIELLSDNLSRAFSVAE